MLHLRLALYRLFPGQKLDERHFRLAFLLASCKHSTNSKSLGAQLAEAKVAEARVLQVARSRAPLDMVQLRRLLNACSAYRGLVCLWPHGLVLERHIQASVR